MDRGILLLLRSLLFEDLNMPRDLFTQRMAYIKLS
jgi:hypothetical protein